MKMKTLMFAALGLVCGLVLADTGAQAQATRTWVSGVGDDANPCSRTAPCKTFAGAISKTAASGEIDCLDPGGFGAVTITKALTLDCTQGFGSILVAGTNAITVAAGASDRVVIRGISFQGVNPATSPGLTAIQLNSGGQLSVERCFINGFSQNGISASVTAASTIYVTNTYITNVNNGIVVDTTAGNVQVVVDHTTIANPATNGFKANGGSVLATITNSVISNAPGSGVVGTVGTPQIAVDTSTVVYSATAFNAGNGTTMYISNNNIYNNGTNFSITAGGAINSAGNNRTTPGGATNPSGTITLK
jgi:hypothetical protein